MTIDGVLLFVTAGGMGIAAFNLYLVLRRRADQKQRTPDASVDTDRARVTN